MARRPPTMKAVKGGRGGRGSDGGGRGGGRGASGGDVLVSSTEKKLVGVHANTHTPGRWHANLSSIGKVKYLGTFGTPEEAARAHDRMVIWCELHEEPRRRRLKLNFSRGEYEREREDIRAVPTRDAMVTRLRHDAKHTGGGVASLSLTSTWRGMCIDRSTGLWRAQCYVDGKLTSLGTYDTPAEAARAYDRMIRWCHLHEEPRREGFKLNFPRGDYEREREDVMAVPTRDAMVTRLRHDAKRTATASLSLSSTWRGITIGRSTGQCRAQCRVDGKLTYLGTYDTPAEAARGYDRMTLWCHLNEEPRRGGFKLNFPRDDYKCELKKLTGTPYTREAMVKRLRQQAREQRQEQANAVEEGGSDDCSEETKGRKRKASLARACDNRKVGVANDDHDDRDSGDDDDGGEQDGGGSNEGSDADDDYDVYGDDDSNGGGSGIKSDGDIDSLRKGPDDGAQALGPTTSLDALALHETLVPAESATEHDAALAAAAKSAAAALPANEEHLVLGAARDMDASDTVMAEALEKQADGAKVGSG